MVLIMKLARQRFGRLWITGALAVSVLLVACSSGGSSTAQPGVGSSSPEPATAVTVVVDEPRAADPRLPI